MKLRSGKTITHEVIKKVQTNYPYEFNCDTIVLFENKKRFILRRGSDRDWALYVDNPKTMMLITHSPYTSLDMFNSGCIKIRYNDKKNSVFIKRPIASYTLEFKNADEYALFKSLRLDNYFNFY